MPRKPRTKKGGVSGKELEKLIEETGRKSETLRRKLEEHRAEQERRPDIGFVGTVLS
ncbi:MAG: hypothetical protein UW07_C0043G0001 [Candidatus Nomurabacteria bacterium GW2011_GWF2_43_8]|uniref:Uncharacterized protein n=1 Tax=Candidatus Nomurabacteria bacterium GW2011_GWF2_43_8 TaxID=1618779 RepID=A0A0G1FJJ5_9BACT|nr:MAG: hypothetical protein UW07_C0043G0001 [Candidatus Nomurabacteria bacterium GW2011_GWF2_43_8]